MIKTWSQYSLTTKVLVGMVTGLATGLVTRTFLADSFFVAHYITDGLFHVIGQIFISSLKMLVVPLIFTSIICGTCSLSDASTLGRLGAKTLLLYLFTTAVAITLAIVAGLIVKPGVGANLEAVSTFTPQDAPAISDILIHLVVEGIYRFKSNYLLEKNGRCGHVCLQYRLSCIHGNGHPPFWCL